MYKKKICQGTESRTETYNLARKCMILNKNKCEK